MEYKGKDFYCDIALKDPSLLKKEYESENVLAFYHTNPHWPVHIVVVPKKHIASFTAIDKMDDPIIIELFNVVKTVAKKIENEQGAAKIITNLGEYQDSKHLHFHIGSGDPLRY